MSLYRKYRPRDFAQLVGQEHVRTTLRNALKTGNVHHAYLFTGPRGTGKTSTARLLAKAINCENLQNSEPCDRCEICVDISEGRLIDVIEIDAASNRGIDEIRDLKEKIQFAPTRAKNKVYIIDEVHMLTKEAFNALLKTLEEPPAQVYFILATTEVHKIPETILSRCQRFDFKRIDQQTLADRLRFIAEQEGFSIEDEALAMIIHHVEGGLRDAIGLLEQLVVDGKLQTSHVREVLGISGRSSIEKLFAALQACDAKAALQEIHDFYHEGFDLVQLNKDFLEFLRQKLLASVESGNELETGCFLEWISFFQEAYESIRHASIVQLPLEIACIQACGNFQESSTESIHKQNSEIAPVATNIIVDAMVAPKAAATPNATAPTNAPIAMKTALTNETVLTSEREHQTLPKVTADTIAMSAPEHQPFSKISGQPMAKTSTFSPEQSPAATSALSPEQLPEQPKNITLNHIQKSWRKIAEHLKIPAVRRLFPTMKALALDQHDLTIAFPDHFSKEKLMETANRLDLEQALFQVFGANFKILSEVEAMHFATDNTESVAKTEGAETLLEVFGGEMI